MNGRNRLSWDEYALALAKTAALRSEDPYVQVGACCLRHDGSVCSLGYNGAPPGVNIDWIDRDNRRKFVLHAETNCLRYCSPNECKLMAVTMLPCTDCLRQIAGVGIKKVIFAELYSSTAYGETQAVMDLADTFGVQMMHILPTA